MSDYRQDPPPDELIEMIFYKDGSLYWKPEFCKGNRKENKPIGYVDKYGYKCFTSTIGQENKAYRGYKVHRVIFYILTGEWPPVVDHKDRNTLNNDISNLRSATWVDNGANREKSIVNTSGYVGVTPRCKKFSAVISKDDKCYEVRGFHDAKHAALFRDLMAHYIQGSFANFNILGKKKIRINGELIA